MVKRLLKHFRKNYTGHAAAYVFVWGGLLVLTGVTVVVSYFNFGDLNVFIAMLVATIKAALVALFFMHLKYDNRLNQVVFISGVVFLAVFVALTASDELFRHDERPMTVPSAEASAEDPRPYAQATPALLAKGLQIYSTQCFICHGVSGQGDGPAGAALQPPPRNFTSGLWKQGGGPFAVYQTVSHGVPGTSMAAFAGLTVEERMAVAHYVRTFDKNAPADRPQDLEFLQGRQGGPAPKPGPKIPVSFAIQRLLDEDARR